MTLAQRAPVRDDEPTQEIIRSVAPSSATPARDRLMLIVLSGPEAGSLVPVEGDELVIGRAKDVGARFDDGGLSRRHARIYRRNEAWYVEDLGSTNGTSVAGVQLHAPRQLREGDRIQVGRDVLLEVTLQDAVEHEAARQLYDSAVRDPLTKVYNRRYLQERLEAELAFARRHATPLSVLVLDVDHFKRVNDTLGHQAGDAVLRVVGGTLQRMIRTEDVVGRWGGEEFVVIARGIDARNAVIFGERIRKLIAGLSIPWDRPLRVTVSVGVATHTAQRPYADVEALFQAADEALYRAKRKGRNRCESAPAGLAVV